MPLSKNVTIKEGATSKQFSAQKLKTNMVGGGTCLWVPEDETRLTTKNITENGTYLASDDGYYGYSQVTVNGIGAAIGTTPESLGGDGNEHAFTTEIDPETGEAIVVDTKLPSSITVSRPPTKTQYNDGDSIDITGLYVVAHFKDGTPWLHPDTTDGNIPLSELTIDPTVADYSESQGGSYTPADNPWGIAPFAVYPALMLQAISVTNGSYIYIITGASNPDIKIFIIGDKSSEGNSLARVFFCTSSPNEYVFAHEYHKRWQGGWADDGSKQWNIRTSFTYDNKTVYYAEPVWGVYRNMETPYGSTNWEDFEFSPFNTISQMAWLAVYGTPTGGTGSEDIAVKWQRIVDNKILESSFTIDVTAQNE